MSRSYPTEKESRYLQPGICSERQDAGNRELPNQSTQSNSKALRAGDHTLSQKPLHTKRSALSPQASYRRITPMPDQSSFTYSQPENDRETLISIPPRDFTPVLWLTGLPAAGKSTIAELTGRRLATEGIPFEVLDGDEVRKAISPTLGYSRDERALQARRLAWAAEMLSRHGIVAIVAAVTPYRLDREAAATLLGCRFAEIWVHADVSVCRTRDPKGLWRRCDLGEISDVTGFDAPYEEPAAPTIKLETETCTAADCADKLVEYVVSTRTRSLLALG